MGGHTNNWKIQEMVSFSERKAFATVKRVFSPYTKELQCSKRRLILHVTKSLLGKHTYSCFGRKTFSMLISLSFRRKKKHKTIHSAQSTENFVNVLQGRYSVPQDKGAHVTNSEHYSLPQYLTNIITLLYSKFNNGALIVFSRAAKATGTYTLKTSVVWDGNVSTTVTLIFLYQFLLNWAAT